MRMKRKKGLAVGLTTVFVLQSLAIPTFANEWRALSFVPEGIYGEVGTSGSTPSNQALEDDLAVDNTQNKGSLDISVSLNEQQVQKGDSGYILSFDFNRKRSRMEPNTFNDLINPGPILVEIIVNEDVASDSLKLVVSPEIEQKINISKEQLILSKEKTISFEVSFTDLDALTGNFDLSEQINKNKISLQKVSDNEEIASFSVLYSAVGEADFYSANYMEFYDGTVMTDWRTGSKYMSVGTIDLKDYNTASIKINHHVQTVKTREDCMIERAELYEEGDYTFEDGSIVQIAPTLTNGAEFTSGIRMKREAFDVLKKNAENARRDVDTYYALSDFRYYYTDGYEAGGRMSGLPLVVRVTYDYRGSGGSGGGGGGGGSSSGGSTVNKPAAETRTATVVATQEDIGWVLRDGIWYYVNGDHKDVVGWLQTLDGRWYYLDMGGRMRTGWSQVDGNWYYLHADGAMGTGWVIVDQQWYYLQGTGAMLANTTTPDGYKVGVDGVWLP